MEKSQLLERRKIVLDLLATPDPVYRHTNFLARFMEEVAHYLRTRYAGAAFCETQIQCVANRTIDRFIQQVAGEEHWQNIIYSRSWSREMYEMLQIHLRADHD